MINAFFLQDISSDELMMKKIQNRSQKGEHIVSHGKSIKDKDALCRRLESKIKSKDEDYKRLILK